MSGTADALHAALSMTAEERLDRTVRLREISERLPPARWLAEQIVALD